MNHIQTNKEVKSLIYVLYQHSLFLTKEYKLNDEELVISEFNSFNFSKTQIPLENIDSNGIESGTSNIYFKTSIILFSLIISGLVASLYLKGFSINNLIPVAIFGLISCACIYVLSLNKTKKILFFDNITQKELFSLKLDNDHLQKADEFIKVLNETILRKQQPSTFDKFAHAALTNNRSLEDPYHHLNALSNLGMVDDFLYNRLKNSIREKLNGTNPTIQMENVIKFPASKI